MLIELSPVQWFAFLLGSVIVLFFVAIAVRALLILTKLIWHGIFGEVVEVNKDWPDNILSAITPLKGESRKKEYAKAIEILMNQNDKLVEQNKKLMSEYLEAIEEKPNMGQGE